MTRSIASLVVVILGSHLYAADPAVWPQWRGPTRDGHVVGAPWPNTLKGDALKQLWRVELDDGYPGPVVSADRVFVAETVAKKDEQVRALDRHSGRELWKVRWEGAMSMPFFARRNGDWIRSTPAFDGQSLYVAGIRDLLVCLDAATGKERWRVDFVARFKSANPAFGFVCSPLVDDDAVYVQAGGGFVKLNKATGETVWRVLDDGGGMYGSAFASPYRTTLQGKDQLLVQTRSALNGVEPSSGKTLWSQKVPATRGMNILTPTVFEDKVFTSAHGAKTYLFRLDKGDDATVAVKEEWTTREQGYMCSPVIVNGHAYLLKRGRSDSRQPMICIDLKSGKVTWTSEQDFGEYASLVAQGDRILALDNRGKLSLLRANPQKFDLIDERKISDQETWGHLAVCGDELFVREQRGVTAWRWR